MYFGRHQLGAEFPITVQCRDVNGEPAWPDKYVTISVWQGGSQIVGSPFNLRDVCCYPLERSQVTGVFVTRVHLVQGDPGVYNCVFRWQVGSFNGVKLGAFEIVAGGGPNGTCLSMIYFQPPSGQFLVRQTDCGQIYKGKNPQ